MSSFDISFYIDLVHRLRKLPTETGWYEFKMNNEKPDLIGSYISALSNSATLEGKEKGYLIWGIHNDTKEIEGTTFNPFKTTVGNEELENWLITLTKPRLDIRFIELNIESKNVIILEVPCSSDIPTSFKNVEYIRVGSYVKNLKDFPEKERTLWRHFDKSPYEMMLAMENISEAQVTEFLNCAEYFTLMKLPLPSNRKAIVEKMNSENFIIEMDNGNYAITNMGALLFAKDLNQFHHLKRKAIRVIQYKGTGRTNAIREEVFSQGYAIAFENICRYIASQIPQSEEITGVFRETYIMFPDKAIREMVGNLIIHQDLTVRGAGPMIEIFDTRLE
jgi:predicted HTH transcriptional regulator